MGNVALLLKSLGHEVCGSDTAVYPPMSDVLYDAEITIYEGYDAERLQEIAPDYVVVGNAMSRGNPEVEFLLESRSIPYYSLPELLRHQVLLNRFNIVVSGTHGKTTTTSIAAYLLESLGLDPGYLIGGVPRSLPSGSHIGSPEAPFVIEGDEYDSAFFDKRSKFIHYLPSILIINNLEFDHADIFRDLQDVQRTFSHVLRVVPRNGYVLINGDDGNIEQLLPADWTTVYRVGTGSSNDLQIKKFSEGPEGTEFYLSWKGKHWGRVLWQLPGLYNARNAAMAALASGLAINPDDPTCISLDSLAHFQSVKRRQEILFEDSDLIVMEDFAHHPTAVGETLISLKNRYPDYKLTACFEPRSNTACRNIHQNTLGSALNGADHVCIAPVHRAEKYADSDRLDTHRIVQELQQSGTPAQAYSTNEQLLTDLENGMSSGRNLICFISNGSFDGIMHKFAENCQKTLSGV